MNTHTTVLLLAVLLHALLLTLLFLRGVARRLPFFTTLLAFYLLRSLSLYALFGHIDADAYAFWFNALDLVDLLLQILVVWELFRATRSNSAASTGDAIQPASSTLRHAALFAALLLISAATSWIISVVVPSSPRAPLDRGVLLTGGVMLLAALLSIPKSDSVRPSLPRRLLFGFGVLGATNILCQIERSLAAFHRAPVPFLRWSWIEAVAYLAVVLFWIWTIAMHPLRTLPEVESAPQAA
jgi:hypothetical protein